MPILTFVVKPCTNDLCLCSYYGTYFHFKNNGTEMKGFCRMNEEHKENHFMLYSNVFYKCHVHEIENESARD